MRMNLKKALVLILLFLSGKVFSQEPLPQFSLVERGGRVTVSWANPYPNLIQLNVQRSYDSLRNFATIYSATSPSLPQNGFTEKKPPTPVVFYRIFFVLEDGSYYFTKSRRAGGGPTELSTYEAPPKDLLSQRDFTSQMQVNDQSFVTIVVNEEVYKRLPANVFKNFRDSILHQTRDTIFAVNDTLVGLSPYVAKENWKPSLYIYMNRDGYINISVPFAGQKKYSVKFFEENGSSLFEIHSVKESPLLLDKATFVHSGWFYFELYEDNKLKEKNKIYVPKDF